MATQAFYEPTLNRQIATHEMGGGEAPNDFMGRLWNMGGVETRKGLQYAILKLKLKSPILGHRMCGNSAQNPKISGFLADRIAKTLIYGNRTKSDTDLKIETVGKAQSDFA